ncbi:MAG: U32 family peptidase [Clostridiales bacterium]|nr:U32 family peptidase [Clostridiales bacterium]
MKTDKMPELLAPAGSIEALRAAVNAGADAVYIGGQQFGARAYADNPSEKEILEGIEYCHLRGRKIYLTVNTLLKEHQLYGQLEDFLAPLYQQGIDAVLVQDLGVMKWICEHFPDLPIHASTQMSITTPEGTRFLIRQGVSRIVPARELTLSEVRAIAETGIEVETFIHGAMCYSYSGRCLFSSMLGGRSGNRGRCAQPCRLPYSVESDRISPSCESRGKQDTGVFSAWYPLSMKDMCALDLLPDLADAGIASFKIEGRMKPPQYSAGVSAVYRKYIDLYAREGRKGYRVEETDRRALLDLFDRGGFSQGYYDWTPGGGDRSSMVVMKRPKSQSAQEAQLKNQKNRCFLKENSKIKINGVLRIYPDMPVILKVWTIPYGSRRQRDAGEEDKGVCVTVKGGIPEKARSSAATVEEVTRRMKKTGGTDFEFENLTVDLAEGLFLPVSMLNELRREALQKLRADILSETLRHYNGRGCPENITADRDRRVKKNSDSVERRISILVTKREQLDAVLTTLKENEGGRLAQRIDTVYLDSFLLEDREPLAKTCRFLVQVTEILHSVGVRCFFAAPPVLHSLGRRLLVQPDVSAVLSQMDGFLVSSVDELEFFRERYPKHLFASEDCLYTFNTEARSLLCKEGITRFTLPAELNQKELGEAAFPDSEMLLYGYQPLMQSAQCVRRNTSGCLYKKEAVKKPQDKEGERSVLYLRDRKNASFPVLTRCRFCTNTIYNSVPLRLFGCREQVMRLGIPFFRLLFTVETKDETLRILRECEAFLMHTGDQCQSAGGLRGTGRPDTEGTRGHFKRGVE